MDAAIFFLLMYVVVSPSYTLEGENICEKNVTTESGELETKKICCKDSEEKNDKCVECSPGFRGWNCTDRCPENHYGRKCSTKCSCNETQICHPVCGCLQRLGFDNSNITNNGTSIFVEKKSSPYAEECSTTKNVFSRSTGSVTETHPVTTGSPTKDTNSNISFLIGAATVTGVCIIFGIGLLYRLHLMRKKQEWRVHHNMVYDLEDTSRIRENPSEEPAEPLYGECSYEEACYSTLVLRVNNESGREPNTSRQPVFTDDDNIYEFVQRYTHHSNEGQPPNVYITDLTKTAE